MNEKIQLLKADIDADLAEIATVYDKLASYSTPLRDPEKVIVAGYYLHNLYTAFEQLCVLVATAFENQISDRSQWHSLLLRRMTQVLKSFAPDCSAIKPMIAWMNSDAFAMYFAALIRSPLMLIA